MAAGVLATITLAGCSFVSSFDGYGGASASDSGTTTPVDSGGSSSGDATVPTDGSPLPDGSSGTIDSGNGCPTQNDPALLAWYRFEDGSGKKGKDCSGKGNDGTIEGTGAFTAGKSGGGLRFNGTSTCIDGGVGTAKGLSAFTVSAWVNITDYDKAGIARYITAVTTDSETRGWRFGSEQGGGFGVKLGQASGAPVALLSPLGAPTNAWKHVGMVYTKDVGLEVYVDGGRVANGASAPQIVEDNAAHLRVGCFHSTTSDNYHFSGILDDVRVYSRSLSAAEMAQLAL